MHEKNIAIARTLLAVTLMIDVLFSSPAFFHLPFDHSISLFRIAAGFEKGVTFLICIWVIAGYFPVFSAIVFCWLAYSVRCAEYIVNGGNNLTVMLSVLMVPVCLSLNPINHWRKAKTLNFPIQLSTFFAVLLIQIQVIVVYYFSAYEKLIDPLWQNGSAIFYASDDAYVGWSPMFTRFSKLFFASYIPSVIVAWTVMALEFLLAFGVFFNHRIRKILLSTGIVFHVLIAIFHGLISFSLVMFAALILLLFPMKRKT